MINRRNFLSSILPASVLPFVSSPTPGATASLAALFPDAPSPKFNVGDRVCISWICDDERDAENFGKRFTEHGVVLGGVFNNGLIEFSGAEVYKESNIWNYLVLVDGTDGDNPYVIFEKESDLVAANPKPTPPKSEPVAAFEAATPAPKFKMGDYVENRLIVEEGRKNQELYYRGKVAGITLEKVNPEFHCKGNGWVYLIDVDESNGHFLDGEWCRESELRRI